MKFLVLILSLLAGQARGAVAGVSSDGSPSYANSNPNVSSFTFPHTTGSGNNRILVVSAQQLVTSGPAITSVTWNSLPLTAAENFQNAIAGSAAICKTGIFYLLNPAASTTANVVVTFGSSGGSSAWATNFSGANQTTPFGTKVVLAPNANPGSTSLSSNITITAGSAILCATGHDDYATLDTKLVGIGEPLSKASFGYATGLSSGAKNITNTYALGYGYMQVLLEIFAAPESTSSQLSPYTSNTNSNWMFPKWWFK